MRRNLENLPIREGMQSDLATRSDITAFQVFISRYGSAIESARARSEDIETIIYSNFYALNIDARVFESNADFVQKKREYEEEIGSVIDDVRHVSTSGKIELVESMLADGWLYLKTVRGISSQSRIGRMYYNVRPEALPSFYIDFVQNCYHQGLPIDSKIRSKVSVEDFNRTDKMVVYFGEEHERNMVALTREFYGQNPSVFMNDRVRFGAYIPDEKGVLMRGVAIGEDPGENESFGGVRAKILASMLEQARVQGISMQDSRAVLQLFQAECQKHHVDPYHAAFGDSANSFSLIRGLQK